MSLIDEAASATSGWPNWPVSAATHINGVAELHSELLKPRSSGFQRDLAGEVRECDQRGDSAPMGGSRQSGPDLTHHRVGSANEWIPDPDRLRELEQFVDDDEFRAEWMNVAARHQGAAGGLHSARRRACRSSLRQCLTFR